MRATSRVDKKALSNTIKSEATSSAGVAPPRDSVAGAIARRTLDLLVSVLGLTIASPILAVAIALIWADDHNASVIHRRRVLGKGGRELTAYKLRTMHPDAENWLSKQPELFAQYQANFKLTADPRVTPIGRTLRKYSIDELPQLVNVARGQMSLVGPRMVHPDEIARFGNLGPLVLSVKPGITGLWQISGRQDTNFSRRLELDREYLRTRSLWRDLMILVKTIPAVLHGRGAY